MSLTGQERFHVADWPFCSWHSGGGPWLRCTGRSGDITCTLHVAFAMSLTGQERFYVADWRICSWHSGGGPWLRCTGRSGDITYITPVVDIGEIVSAICTDCRIGMLRNISNIGAIRHDLRRGFSCDRRRRAGSKGTCRKSWWPRYTLWRIAARFSIPMTARRRSVLVGVALRVAPSSRLAPRSLRTAPR